MSVPLTQALGMTDLSSSKTLKFARWLPALFGVLAISYFASWWLRGNITNLFFGIGLLLIAQHNYFYPATIAGSLRGELGPVRYKRASQVMSTVGVVTLVCALLASWL